MFVVQPRRRRMVGRIFSMADIVFRMFVLVDSYSYKDPECQAVNACVRVERLLVEDIPL